MKIRPILFTLALCGCTTFQNERRVAPPDQTLAVQKLLVMPMMVTRPYCREDIDRLAQKDDDVTRALTQTVIGNLKSRSYKLVPALIDPDELDPKLPANRELGAALCSGKPLDALPPSVLDRVRKQAKAFKADQVLVGGISRMRWHLKTQNDEDNGVAGDQMNEFTVRAAAALYDVASDRLVWDEYVDTKFLTGSYDDAVKRVMLFDSLHNRDPHEKLFYDFPPAGK